MISKMKKDYQQGGEIKIYIFFWKKLVSVHSLVTEDFTFDKVL